MPTEQNAALVSAKQTQGDAEGDCSPCGFMAHEADGAPGRRQQERGSGKLGIERVDGRSVDKNVMALKARVIKLPRGDDRVRKKLQAQQEDE